MAKGRPRQFKERRDAQRGPGGRHDNDFADFHDIIIYPTRDELQLETSDVYLPRAGDVAQQVEGQDRLASHIDGQFRLLRENMLCDLREELAASAYGRPLEIKNLALVGIHCDNRVSWSLKLMWKESLRKRNGEQRKIFFLDHPKFQDRSPLCLFVQNEFLTLGTLVYEEKLLGGSPCTLCVHIPVSHLRLVLTRLKAAGSGVRLLFVDTAIFMYEPVLKQLKKIWECSLALEIVAWRAGLSIPPPDYSVHYTLERLLENLSRDYSFDLRSCLQLERSTRLDAAQAKCFRAALQQRVVLMQGPPGTGKSFIGSLVGKAIHQCTNEKILVVCYTHHALDDFVQHLLSLGIPAHDIVRLGSTQKATPLTKPLALSEYKQNVKFTREQWSTFDARNQEATKLAENLNNAFKQFINFNPYSESRHEYNAFWRPTHEECNQNWYHEMSDEPLDQVYQAIERYDHKVEEVNAARLKKDLTVMSSKRVIACTTTAAAKYCDIIQRVSPGVVIVEEAGETLESHVWTALGPETKHLILIGDHKQLRPKVNYELSVEKGTGYDLNRSLFERLILKGFPFQTLSSQHRMRPEISALIRKMTYPDLKDAKATQGRPNLHGSTDNIIFVNHKERESELSGTHGLDDSKPTSKQNQFEAQMALKCVQYLREQGYGTEDFVVLTPYLGQLQLLHDKLKVDSNPALNDLDSRDLVRAGLMPKKTASANKPCLRISTVDNFQGEEANIVIASLCRSNFRNNIGFMSAPERLNVLVSRARNALILIGNAETFTGARNGGALWSSFIGMLKADRHVYDGFPVRCERHPYRMAILRRPADFDSGVCEERCNQFLNCGVHQCPYRCHSLHGHSNIKCIANVSSKCAKGHVSRRACRDKDPIVCAECRTEARKAREVADQQYWLSLAELNRNYNSINVVSRPDEGLWSRFFGFLTSGLSRIYNSLPLPWW